MQIQESPEQRKENTPIDSEMQDQNTFSFIDFFLNLIRTVPENNAQCSICT